MNERRKLINWMAGVTTFIVVLLIVIVLLDREEDGVSLAAASRTVALTLESGMEFLKMRRRRRILMKIYRTSGM